MAGGGAGVADLRGFGFLSAAAAQPASHRAGDALKAQLAEQAGALGFDAFGICAPDSIPEAPARLRAFLDAGYHGDMAWLADRPERRSDPRVMWSEVKSVIMLGFNYGPDTDPRAVLARKDRGAISVYAQGDDYHDVIKARLKQFARGMVASAGGDVKVFIDTAAVMEKPLAQAAGLGWQGRHTNLVSAGRGSWMFLGAVFTTLDLPRDEAERDHCGSCRACLDACPTAAFPTPYQLDARRCISYLTIEHKGPIPHEFRGRLGNRIYGCDDCLAACPWNKFAQAGREAKLAARDGLRAPALAELVGLDDPSFRALFTKSPVKRIGRDRFIRNVLIAIGNSGDRGSAPEAERLLADPSPTIRGAAVWALAQLLPPERFAGLKAPHLAGEPDQGVRAEWGGGDAEEEV
ncbi:tRNA epoxyqueuosine(34) reductase QueG [Rhodopseudomonas palustris]|uniref:Epoxyqueuosine reductase n=1 Tax=Rhodopseudomonas palustris TaxID=1076 RepID=A0A323UEL3_RHOPL|nr:tRNA epoxyqueuosine(34) reductase QueG [Rhodopseudomonas palustris]PZA10647.1 tRNA epoxyqueuosine(34) reductase QueG [Rhodopseudomonas palustris]